MKYLLDTSICIYVINGRPDIARTRFKRHHTPELSISVITALELRYGAYKSARREENLHTIQQFLAPIRLLEFSADDANVAAELRARLETAGQPVGHYDLQIAAQALTRDLILVTNNLREFKRVPGLKLENWVA